MSRMTAPETRDERHRWFSTGTHITIRGLRKCFGEVTLYDHFDLDIARGKLVSVFGPNGCGKSTLINMMAGILRSTAGRFFLTARRFMKPGSVMYFRTIGRRLFPWLRAIDNLRYPLKFLDLPEGEKNCSCRTLDQQL